MRASIEREHPEPFLLCILRERADPLRVKMIGKILLFIIFCRIQGSRMRCIDHVLGRPPVKFRKYQVLLVLAFWSTYLYKYVLH